MKNQKLKLNADLGGPDGSGFSAGATINIKVDKKGIPLDLYWRKRLKDSEIDGCVELVTAKAAKAAKSQVQE